VSGIEVIPSAKRLIKSLRDMGYDFSQAVADVVDNSIEAGATLVAIDVEFDGDDSWVRIADNGTGMKPDVLREAMRYGAERQYADDDLGKFGLGLKTASMSQCQCLSVASRWNPDRADIAAYSWDLDHIERTNRWEILPLDRSGLGKTTREPLKDTTGTVVLWQRLDRILGYRHPYGEAARKHLSQTCREIELHLGMVFHRFLSGEVRRKRFKLLLNGNEIKPWDPFCRSEERTRPLQAVSIPVLHEGVSGEVLLESFVLPHQEDFSSPEAFRNASGPASWNQQQGFYMYRAGRMIQSGGWSNLRARDEHTKLARIAVSFAPALDEAFKVNVAKMRVQMPAVIRDAIREATSPVVKLARETYDRKSARSGVSPRPVSPLPGVTHSGGGVVVRPAATGNGAPVSMPAQTSSDNYQIREPSGFLTLQEWSEMTLNAADAVERPVVQSVLNKLRK
jgi:Histidine kinase-, DNA gyrase B-, and HSP90-like ATPase